MIRRTFSRSGARMRRVDQAFFFAVRACLVATMIVAALAWVMERDVFRITSVTVRGAHATDSEKVIQLAKDLIQGDWYSNWFPKDSVFLYPRSKIVKEIPSYFDWVRTVNVHIVKRGLTVDLTEYVPAFIWCGDKQYATSLATPDSCWFATLEGEIFAHAPTYSGYPFPRIVSVDAGVTGANGSPLIFPTEKFVRLKDFLSALNREGFTIRAVEHLEGADVRIYTDRPWSILWESTEDVDSTIRKLSVALQTITTDISEQTPVYEVDLRFGDKIFTR